MSTPIATVLLSEQGEALTVEAERSILGGHHYVYVASTASSRPSLALTPAEALAFASALVKGAKVAHAAALQEAAEQAEYERLGL